MLRFPSLDAKEFCGVYNVFFIPLEREYYKPPNNNELERRAVCHFEISSCVFDAIQKNHFEKNDKREIYKIKIKESKGKFVFYLNEKKRILLDGYVLKGTNNKIALEVDRVISLGEKCSLGLGENSK